MEKIEINTANLGTHDIRDLTRIFKKLGYCVLQRYAKGTPVDAASAYLGLLDNRVDKIYFFKKMCITGGKKP